jgi:hypothetical protein
MLNYKVRAKTDKRYCGLAWHHSPNTNGIIIYNSESHLVAGGTDGSVELYAVTHSASDGSSCQVNIIRHGTLEQPDGRIISCLAFQDSFEPESSHRLIAIAKGNAIMVAYPSTNISITIPLPNLTTVCSTPN